MREFLLFRLYGPFASWGDIAVGERRGSWNRPSKSAVLGLVAAAQGIERQDSERLAALADAYGFAVRVDSAGIPLRDYHTTQTVREADMRKLRKADARPMTRRRELSVDSPETILSQRDYYLDAHYTVALWCRTATVPTPLDELRTALRRPHFVPYLGRKSCPLALPLAPDIVVTGDLVAALALYKPPTLEGSEDILARFNRGNARAILAWEGDVVPEALDRLQAERRRDQPGDRERWQFAEREEWVAVLP